VRTIRHVDSTPCLVCPRAAMASAFEEAAVVPPDSGYVFDWPGIQERPDSKLEVRYFIGEARYVAFLLDFNDFWFNGRYQYYKFDGQSLDRNELAVLCGQEEAEKVRSEHRNARQYCIRAPAMLCTNGTNLA
jgi:hypothetical protein